MIAKNRYPGRGIICGLAADGKRFCTYFITARSEASRNRILSCQNERVATALLDPAQKTDPELLVYTAMQRQGDALVVANGDHGDQIVASLAEDIPFVSSLHNVLFEPDEPHYTPRIAAVAEEEGYSMSIIRRSGLIAGRTFYHYPYGEAGTGRIMHTYQGEGHPLPHFIGDPRPLCIEAEADAVGKRVWEELAEAHRLAVATWVFDTKKKSRVEIIDERNPEGVWTALT
ncbi:MAG TPA: IMP cyclohydrolase [Sphaerochaeta sp.]|nr:IMP cyclohydrolase [Sphaerochaeta sp.]